MINEYIKNAGIAQLNEMQVKMQEVYPKNDAILLLSPTGSGKTLAFLLPLCADVVKNGSTALILSPSRELSQQIFEVLRSLKSGIKATLLCGGHSTAEEEKRLREKPSIVIGTPGRVLDHIRRQTFAASTINTWVVDEFDKALEMGFSSEMQSINDSLTSVDKRIFVSATSSVDITPWTGEKPVETLDFTTETPNDNLKLMRVTSPEKDKLPTLQGLVTTFNNESTIVFCNFRDTVERVADALKKDGHDVVVYHGKLEQKDRERALFMFASGCSAILVTTDLAARGLDISQVKHVVHFEMPNTLETFTHRNGRTARQTASGTAYVMIYREFSLPDFLPKKLEEYKFEPTDSVMKSEFTPVYISRGKKEKISRGDVAGFVIKTAELAKEDVGMIILYDHYSHVAIRSDKALAAIKKLDGAKIKGGKAKVEIAK